MVFFAMVLWPLGVLDRAAKDGLNKPVLDEA